MSERKVTHMYIAVDDVFRISVRNLVEFMCTSGDIVNRDVSFPMVKVMAGGGKNTQKDTTFHGFIISRGGAFKACSSTYLG